MALRGELRESRRIVKFTSAMSALQPPRLLYYPGVPKPEVQILVCVKERPEGAATPCCEGRGSNDLYYRLKDLVRARGLKDSVLITKTGCLHHCSRGITVAVWPQNHWYGGVTVEDAEDLLIGAVEGVEVGRLRMPDGPWE